MSKDAAKDVGNTKKFSLGEILTVASGCHLTEKCPVALIEHVTGWECRSDFGAVERYQVAQAHLRAQLPWLKDLKFPAITKDTDAETRQALCSAFLETTTTKFGPEHAVKAYKPVQYAAVNELSVVSNLKR